jgi:hypothetical protein
MKILKQGLTKEQLELIKSKQRESEIERDKQKILTVTKYVNSILSRLECSYCNSIIEANVDDLDIDTSLPDGSLSISLRCPSCEYELNVPLYNMPDKPSNQDMVNVLYKLALKKQKKQTF